MARIPRPRSVFYGWWIVAAGTVVQMLVGALLQQSYGAYATVLREQFGWSKTLVSAAFSMSQVESGILGPLQGWMIDRFGPRAVMRVGCVIFAAGFILFSRIQSPTSFMLAFFVMAVGSGLMGFLPATTAIVNWFERHRAMALGLMSAGFAAGGLLVPLVVLSLDHFGWRSTAFASGVIVLVVGLPVLQLIRHRPEQYGHTVDGRHGSAPTARPPTAASADFTARQALRTPAFWFISLGHASALLVVSAVTVHLILHLTENLGYSIRTAGLVVALMTASQVVGMLAGGYLGDRISKRVIVVTAMASHATGLLLLAYASHFWMVGLFALLHGGAWGARGPLMQAIRADYFGRRSFGTIMGFSSLIVMVGTTVGPIVAGVLADRTGSYESGFTILAIAAAAGSIFFILARQPTPPGEAERVQAAHDAPDLSPAPAPAPAEG